MTESVGAPAASAEAPTAGRLLREARERQGLHIAALAASIKVAPKKLELLEADRFAELPDATFTRALAQTVCRALKIDAAPVMRLLPPPPGQRLDQVGEGLNTPFRERPGALVQNEMPNIFSKPVVWVTALLAIAAITLYVLPKGVGDRAVRAPGSAASMVSSDVARVPAGEVPGMPPDAALPLNAAPATAMSAPAINPAEPAASTASPAVSVAPPVSSGATSMLSSPVVAAVSPAASSVAAPAILLAAADAKLLQVQTSSPSWVEVTDSRGRSLVAKLVKPGEMLGVDGAPPLRVRIGNATGTRLVFRGQPTDLTAYTRDNVARLELQ